MGGIDKKDQMIQPYLIERKSSKKWYIKFFRRIMNVAVHNAFVLYNTKQTVMNLDFRLDLVKALILTYRPQIPSSARPGRPSINQPPARLIERHFIEKIPPTGSKYRPQRKCAVCKAMKNKRKDTIYWCPDCQVGLCLEFCFKEFHTKQNL